MDLANYLIISVKENASDLHISPGSPPILRINGDLIAVKDAPVLDAAMIKELLNSVMNKEQQKSFESTYDLDFNVILPPPISASFRANAFHQADGPSAVFRVIPSEIPTLDKLESPPVFKKLLELGKGLILLTGPTGCGKSTTLAAMIEHINETQACHIITLEEPIEFKHKRVKSIISQRQIPAHASSFAAALRSALREDPDIILVGEMRDLETIRMALTAAETGHLVMATLHTSSAPRAVSRIIDVFPAGEKNIIKNMLSESLEAVICQILVKRNGGGRIAAHEIMLGTPAIRNLIREEKVAQMYSVMQTSTQVGMSTMEHSFKQLMDRGIITAEGAHESGFEREEFEVI